MAESFVQYLPAHPLCSRMETAIPCATSHCVTTMAETAFAPSINVPSLRVEMVCATSAVQRAAAFTTTTTAAMLNCVISICAATGYVTKSATTKLVDMTVASAQYLHQIQPRAERMQCLLLTHFMKHLAMAPLNGPRLQNFISKARILNQNFARLLF